MPSKDAVLHTSRTRYFQGAGRSQSPFGKNINHAEYLSLSWVFEVFLPGDINQAVQLQRFIVKMQYFTPLEQDISREQADHSHHLVRISIMLSI